MISSPNTTRLLFVYVYVMIACTAVIVGTTVYLTAPAGCSATAALRRYVATLRESYCVGRWAPRRAFWHEMDGRPLPSCSMATCFNASRCVGSGPGAAIEDRLKAYVYKDDGFARPPYYFRALARSRWLTDDPAAACIFLVLEPLELYGLARPRPSFGSLPHWDGGRNHVIVSLADSWPADIVAEPGSIGMAVLAASHLQRASLRAGFDVGIPLPGLACCFRRLLAPIPPRSRRYLLTFRGTRYVGNRKGNVRSSAAFRALHNGGDVVVAATCAHASNDAARRRCPWLGAGCDADEAAFGAVDGGYAGLMNTTFGLAPAGRSPSSFRLAEVMSAGAIPVIVADNYVDPLDIGGGAMIEWRRCALTFGTRELAAIVPALRAMPPAEMEARQAYCLRVYDHYLKDDATLVDSVLRALLLRLRLLS